MQDHSCNDRSHDPAEPAIRALAGRQPGMSRERSCWGSASATERSTAPAGNRARWSAATRASTHWPPRAMTPGPHGRRAVLAGGPGAVAQPRLGRVACGGSCPATSQPVEITSRPRRTPPRRASHPSLPVVTAARHHPPTRRPHHQPAPAPPSTSRHASPPSNSPGWSTTRREAGTCASTPSRTSWTATPSTPAPSSSGPSPRPPPTRPALRFRGRIPRLRRQKYGLPDPADQRLVQRPRGRRVLSRRPTSSSKPTAGNSTTTSEAFEDDRERDAENLRHGLTTHPHHQGPPERHSDREAERLMEILQPLRPLAVAHRRAARSPACPATGSRWGPGRP